MNPWIVSTVVLAMLNIMLGIAAYKLDRMVEKYEDEKYQQWKMDRDAVNVPDVHWRADEPDWKEYRL